MNNDFLKELLKLHPELEEEYNSKQYKMSLEIIDEMMELSYNSKQMAEYLNIDYDFYIRMESGDTSISINEYERVLKKLNDIKSNTIIDDFGKENYILINSPTYTERNYLLAKDQVDCVIFITKPHNSYMDLEIKHRGFKFSEQKIDKVVEQHTGLKNIFNDLKNLYQSKFLNYPEEEFSENSDGNFHEKFKYTYS
ncbi:hypothetical protein ACH434_23045 [Lysinibacillus fusiformis]|uniref:hypothetical protein n=1 Tax=Lysinibacillus fusiformis TaxID=28031 RepID=UPI0037B12FA3